MSRSLYYAIAVPLVLAILFHFLSQKPPLDYGNGFMFDNIAKNYDFINRALSLNMDKGWRKVMIQEVTSDGMLYKDKHPKNKRIKVLDLATGTADVAIMIAEAYRELNGDKVALEVVGVDPSKNMLACESPFDIFYFFVLTKHLSCLYDSGERKSI
jgi:SAM-dependent methyltransferase